MIPTVLIILKLLTQNPGQEPAKSVLPDRTSANTPDCTESSLKTHISKLRSASGRNYVEAVLGSAFVRKQNLYHFWTIFLTAFWNFA